MSTTFFAPGLDFSPGFRDTLRRLVGWGTAPGAGSLRFPVFGRILAASAPVKSKPDFAAFIW